MSEGTATPGAPQASVSGAVPIDVVSVDAVSVDVVPVDPAAMDPAAIDAVPDTVAASYAQQRVWLAQQLDRTATGYNVQAGLRFLGVLDRGALENALSDLVERQSALRTYLAEHDGEVMQVIVPPTPVGLPVQDLSGLPDPAAALEDRARDEIGGPFAADGRPPVRFALFRLADDDHVILLTMDHLMADPWSAGILHEELARGYGSALGDAEPVAQPPVQYADYALWQHDLLDAGDLDGQLGYWRAQLGDDPPRLPLPAAGRHKSRTAASLARPLPEELMQRLTRLGRTTGSSLFMVLLAGYAAILGRHADREDVLIGTLTSGRTRPEVEQLVGFFANLAVLRVDLSGRPTVRELLSRVRGTILDAYANQDVPFQHVVSQLRPGRDGGDHPYFDTLLQLADMRRAPVQLPGVRIEAYPAASQPTPVDLGVTVMLENDGAAVVCEYDTGMFAEQAVQRLLDHYVLMLEAMLADPDGEVAAPELLTEQERRWLAGLASPRPDVPEHWTVARFFEQAAARHGDRLAIDSGEITLTYAELNARANRVAHALRERGVGPETLVGILLEREPDLVTSVLGVLKAGGAYLPLDPAYPADRLRYMVDDANPKWIITADRFADVLPDASGRLLAADLAAPSPGAENDPPPSAAADNLAYVIYTSGSTGQPKGVAICHRGLALLADMLREIFALTPEDRILQLASPSFDVSVSELLWAFGAGAALCIPSSQAVARGDLGELIRVHGPSALVAPPALLSALGDETDFPGLRTVIAGGEACTPQVAARWSPGRGFYNGYGPTEASVCATMHRVTPADGEAETVPIGRPIGGVAVEVLDRDHRRVPVGTPGELCLGGQTLGRGYLGRPGATAEKFIPDPYGARPGGRLYRTGDLVRWRRDGALEFLGRIDRQVKLRGFRIELGEIEARLAAHRAVRDVLVLLREDTTGHPILAAYVVPKSDAAAPTPGELRAHCAVTLPAHMVPAAFVVLDRFPLSPNGKVDQRALPDPRTEPDAADEQYIPPRGPVEQAIAAAWRDILGRERVSASADFFDLGGDSLTATRVINRVRRELGSTVGPETLFDKRTLAEFALAVSETLPGGAED